MPVSTYREWLRSSAREVSRDSLEAYLAENARAEGWTSEFKAAAHDADYGVREAVAALHNGRGGEVFLGVNDSGRVEGSEVAVETLNETLRQSKAMPARWRITDLLQLTGSTTQVDLLGGAKRAFVLEVMPSDLPGFVLDRAGRLVLPVRSGFDTTTLDSASAIEWYARRRRGDVLRSCYRELATFALQLSQHSPLPEGLPDPLPYIQAIIQDGTAYTLLTKEDRAILFGSGTTGGRSSGVVDVYYRTVRTVRDALTRRPEGYRNIAIRGLEGLTFEFANLETERSESVERLARHIRSQGFVVDSGTPSLAGE